MIEIPVPYRPANKVLAVTLDGSRYRIRLRWNERSQTWALSISDSTDAPIATSIKVVPNFDLLIHRRGQVTGCPLGKLIVCTVDGESDPPGRYDLGTGRKARLLYEPAL